MEGARNEMKKVDGDGYEMGVLRHERTFGQIGCQTCWYTGQFVRKQMRLSGIAEVFFLEN